MPRLLIVSANFPPVNTPDMQRVRMSLPHFVAAGWEVVVLTVDDREPMAPLEPELLETIPAAVRVVRARAVSRRWSRWFGVNNLGLRALPFLYGTGCRLLRRQRFDLVYFSTTQFILFPLGRLWRWTFGVPYVIDLQDPWVSDYYDQPGAPRPPGGWKYLFASAAARLLEGWTMSGAAHIISVSERYLDDLARRYPWWTADRGSVLTFGAPDNDLEFARRLAQSAPALLPASRGVRIAYAGRLGPDMLPALEVLFAAIARRKDSPKPVEVYFFGTSYAPSDQATGTTAESARRHGIGHLVHEKPARIGYLDALRILLETDVALLLGSEDTGYSPSKVYPTLLAAKPTIAIAPAASVLEQKIRELGGAALVTFRLGPTGDPAAVDRLSELMAGFLPPAAGPFGPPTDLPRLHDCYSSRAVAERQLKIFAAVAATV